MSFFGFGKKKEKESNDLGNNENLSFKRKPMTRLTLGEVKDNVNETNNEEKTNETEILDDKVESLDVPEKSNNYIENIFDDKDIFDDKSNDESPKISENNTEQVKEKDASKIDPIDDDFFARYIKDLDKKEEDKKEENGKDKKDDEDEEDFGDKRLEDILHIDDEFNDIDDFISATSFKDDDKALKNKDISFKINGKEDLKNMPEDVKKFIDNMGLMDKNNEIKVSEKTATDFLKEEQQEEKQAEAKKEEPKKEEPKKEDVKKDVPQEEKEFSIITSLATTRPIEVAFDLGEDRYLKEPSERLDIHAKDSDLDELLATKPNIKYLDMSDCNELTDYTRIGKFTELEELDMSSIPSLTDVSFLEPLRKLRVLNLSETGLETLENFPDLPNLQVLSLKMNRFRNLNGIESCTTLHDLILWGCTNLENIDAVENFTELRCIDLDSCNPLRNISPIANLTKLVYLNLNFTRIEDLEPIKDLVNLQVFTMDFCPMALSEQNMKYFEKLTKMKFLGLRNRLIRNLTPFKNMKQLAELELGGNAINDLTPLEDMTEMQVLNLSANPSLTDLSPLHNMKKLKKLLISGIKSGKTITIAMLIEDLSVLENMPNLEILESNFNKKLRDISPIRFCKKLVQIHLKDCFGISDVTPLRFCKELKEIYFENDTQIRDISFVKYCTKLEKINIAKSSADRLSLSNWTRLLKLVDLKDGDGTLPIHKAVLNSVKFRKKISKIAVKVVKDEENNE